MAALNEAHDTCMANEVVVDKKTWKLLKTMKKSGIELRNKRPHGAVRIGAEDFVNRGFTGVDVIVPEVLLFDPEWQANAIKSLARYVPEVVWDRLSVGYVC
jgi:hypothetical protein